MENFLWHKVSKKEKEEIKKEVKLLLNSFSKKLSKISDKTNFNIERGEFERKEERKRIDLNRNTLFQNAPEKNKDFIVAEKKRW